MSADAIAVTGGTTSSSAATKLAAQSPHLTGVQAALAAPVTAALWRATGRRALPAAA